MVDRITGDELKALQDSGREFVLVDTRPEEDYEAFHVRGARNVRYSPDDEPSDEEVRTAFEDVDQDDRIVLICARGIAAADLVDRLEEFGYENVQMVDEGMRGWSTVYDVVPLPVGNGIEVIQLQRRAKGCLSYVVGSESSGTAVIVDPTQHTDEFLDVASDAGYEIEAILDTHVHADHISGAPALAAELDVPYYLSEPASKRDVEHDHETIEPNDVLTVGTVDVKPIHTPGHTEGATALLLGTKAVLTADTLHTDSVGRVELAFEDDDAETGARMLYESIHRALLTIPDDIDVYPGHFTVSPDGEYENATPGMPIGTTVGTVRREIELLGLDEELFVDRLTKDVPEEPPNYEAIMAINRGREEPEDKDDAEQLELGPNNCSA